MRQTAAMSERDGWTMTLAVGAAAAVAAEATAEAVKAVLEAAVEAVAVR